MKYCPKCYASNADEAKFCTECGAALNTTATPETVNTTAEVLSYGTGNKSDSNEAKYNYSAGSSQTFTSNKSSGIAPRNIAIAVILSIVTCGIYQIYWFIKMNDEVNTLANDPNAPSGGMAFLFTLISCGLYGMYWSYKMGEKCDKIKCNAGGNFAVLYLILTFVGLGIVTYCLIQDTINKAV